MDKRILTAEELRDENSFLKLKLMLERDASFDTVGHSRIPAEVENAFLHRIIEFERQADVGRTVMIFDKIGRPDRFLPASCIPESGIKAAWQDLSNFLLSHNLALDCMDAHVSPRELYKFATEDFFFREIEDIDMPGMMACFMYCGPEM